VALHQQCSDNIAEANKSYAVHYNKGRIDHPDYKVGDLVLLSMNNVKTLRLMKNLDIRQSGPHEIVELIGTHACWLKLPESMKIHDVFHVALLRPFSSPTFPGQLAEAPRPVEAEGNSEYEVSNIVDSRVNKRT
jgi:hypothetical protein